MKKRKKQFLGLLLQLTALMPAQVLAQQAIMPGDYADPTILRDGKDYYMTHSPFIYKPGFLIWHSTDLVNWEPICRALPEYEGSAMAPDLVKYKNRYYLYYPAKGVNWVIYADDVRGPWSKPVKLDVTGIDPGHVVGEDGKRYLFVDKGEVVPLSDDGLKVVGQKKKVYDGWIYPKNWKTECMCLESPKLTYHDGYYYLTSAEGGTAGPATSHMAVAARSKSIYGPWENSPYNPIVHTYSDTDNWWSKGHGTLVDDADGNWWIVYHAYANDLHTLGRQTLAEPVEWTSDGWYRPATSPRKLQAPKQDAGKWLSDDFMGKNQELAGKQAHGEKLGLQWTFWNEYAPKSVTVGKHQLQMEAKGTTPADGRILLTTATDKNYVVETEVTVDKNAQGGLLLYYSDKGYAGVTSDGKKFTIYMNKEKSKTIPNKLGKRFKVRLHNQVNSLNIEVSKDGKAWQTIAEQLNVKEINHNNYGGFFALRPALPAVGKGKVVYNYFNYKNGVPQEKDMAAYLMVFHRDDTHSLYMAMSRDGYHFTALNNAHPIVAGDTIANQKGIRDPHIYRGPDGAFYLAMTDLHIFAQKEGKRTTEWERDGKTYGWGNNKGLVLMKSWDLIHWSHKIVNITDLSPEFAEIGCAWAPETIYDEKEGKLMIYYTMRFKNQRNRLYYVYVNDDFNKLESEPKLLFEYPDKKTTAIDGDICYAQGKYHLFYVAHEGTPGIKQAVSDKINGDFQFNPRWIDEEPKACEAPMVWKRIGEDKWVLMYDNYGLNKHNFGFEETSDFVNFKQLKHFNEGIMFSTNFDQPKHGAVVHLTDSEARKLAKRWGLDYDKLQIK